MGTPSEITTEEEVPSWWYFTCTECSVEGLLPASSGCLHLNLICFTCLCYSETELLILFALFLEMQKCLLREEASVSRMKNPSSPRWLLFGITVAPHCSDIPQDVGSCEFDFECGIAPC